MLPTDIERLIMEFHDEFDVSTKRFHLNLVFKSAFCEFRGLDILEDHWCVLLYFMNMYDKRLKKLLANNDCYSKLWTGVVPWD